MFSGSARNVVIFRSIFTLKWLTLLFYFSSSSCVLLVLHRRLLLPLCLSTLKIPTKNPENVFSFFLKLNEHSQSASYQTHKKRNCVCRKEIFILTFFFLEEYTYALYCIWQFYEWNKPAACWWIIRRRIKRKCQHHREKWGNNKTNSYNFKGHQINSIQF